MHVPLPKPLHGWREFAGEVGIIVLGVIIALALGKNAPDNGKNDHAGRSFLCRNVDTSIRFVDTGSGR